MKNWQAKHIYQLSTVILSCLLLHTGLAKAADKSKVRVETLLQSDRSWDGAKYQAYPTGQPQLSILKITIPPHTALDWHIHPMPNAGYILSGELIVEKKNSPQKLILHSGDTIAETVGTVHRGYTGDQPVSLVVFYAGVVGMPLSIPQ